MNEKHSSPQFEESVRRSFGVPEIRTEFVHQAYGDLMQRAAVMPRHARPSFKGKPAWGVALAFLSILVIGILAVGPQRVVAVVGRMFGYIPEVGIVEQGAPIRVLAEPVSATRDGITVSVNQATLTYDRTQIDFGVSGVPLSAYPPNDATAGCIEPAYLRLPDGTTANLAVPLSNSVNEVTFVMPCIANTLNGTTPVDWELPLRFIPAPPDLIVLPVIDVTPSHPVMQPSLPVTQAGTPVMTNGPAPTAEPLAAARVAVERVIETEAGYILIGSVQPQVSEGSWLQITGPAVIRDANGRKVTYSFPNNWQALAGPSFNQGGDTWALEINGSEVSFPVTISYSGIVITQVDPMASAQIPFDAGPDPQPEQVWTLNQDVELAGYTVRLISVTAYEDGYAFRIDPGPNLSGVNVQIDGHSADGGGGGGAWGGIFSTSLAYSQLPTGALTIVLSNPLANSPTETWQGQWQPETPRHFAPAPGESTSPICLTADSLVALPPLLDGLDGKMLITELNPEQQIVLTNLDGGQREVLVAGSGRGTLSPDATQLAYANETGITFVDLMSGVRTTRADALGIDLHWSPDGSQLAYTAAGNAYGVLVIDRAGQAAPLQLSNLGYESIAGWSPDGRDLYFAIPSSTNGGFLLRAAEVATGEVRDLFVLADSSRKAPLPAVSPDGNWIAYRASDNSSLYTVRMDGSERRKVIELPAGYAITGIVWGPGGGLLGVSLITLDAQAGQIVLLQPSNCEAYVLPALHGELDGLFIP